MDARLCMSGIVLRVGCSLGRRGKVRECAQEQKFVHAGQEKVGTQYAPSPAWRVGVQVKSTAQGQIVLTRCSK